MNKKDNKKGVIENLEELLVKIIDAKTKENLTIKNKEIALKDLIKLLSFYWQKIKEEITKGSLNEHQVIWYSAIIAVNKKVKYHLIDITSGLFRCYIITLFGSIGKEDMLKQLTGWSTQMFNKEKFTYDMKVLFLSINQIIQNKEKENKTIEDKNNNKIEGE